MDISKKITFILYKIHWLFISQKFYWINFFSGGDSNSIVQRPVWFS